ncbi:MAG: hypothetical protein CBB71_14085 [Rhodopirellula sp. TMED11]|nr:MAG: hypothetical protein CBB71_14085 [Rhodopirellula sp. TMED11]
MSGTQLVRQAVFCRFTTFGLQNAAICHQNATTGPCKATILPKPNSFSPQAATSGGTISHLHGIA